MKKINYRGSIIIDFVTHCTCESKRVNEKTSINVEQAEKKRHILDLRQLNGVIVDLARYVILLQI